MADKTIGELPKAGLPLGRDGKIPAEYNGIAQYFTVGELKDAAEAAAKEHADKAEISRAAAIEAARAAADAALHPPILKEENDHWWIWDAERNDYADSGVDAGVSLTVSPETVTGEPGSAAKVENIGTETDPVLRFTIPRGEKGEAGDIGLPPHLIVGEDSELGAVLPVNADTLEGHPAEYYVSDGKLAEELAKKQNALPYYSNGNLLRNWCLAKPVNQQRKKKYGPGTQYTVDGWKLEDSTGSTLTVDIIDKGIELTTNDGEGVQYWFTQNTEFVGDGETTYTFSVLVDDVIATPDEMSIWFDGGAGIFFSAPGLYSVTYKFPEQAAVTCRVVLRNNQSVRLVAAKLELGSQQTLAHQENGVWVLNEIPDYATELLKCQRYYQIFKTDSVRPVEAEDFRPVMRVRPALGTIEIGGQTYYTADANL